MAVSDYDALARLFDYPREGYAEGVAEVMPRLVELYPTAAEELQVFADRISCLSLDERQELYTRTFDVQAITTLDVGYVLYGDDYKRGEVLSNLNREHNEAGNDCGTELADHLPNLLRLIAILGKTELVVELVDQILAPALRSMVREFDGERLEKKTKFYKKQYKTLIDSSRDEATLYVHSLIGLYAVLRRDFASIPEVDDSGNRSDQRFPRLHPDRDGDRTGQGSLLRIEDKVMSALNTFLFIGLPYIALAVFFVGTIVRYRSTGFKVSSLSSQFLEGKNLFWGRCRSTGASWWCSWATWRRSSSLMRSCFGMATRSA